MRPNLIAAVITYHPDKEVIDNILTYYDAVEKVIIVDNSENDSSAFYSLLTPYSKIVLITNHANLGLGKALNIAAEKAIEKGYKWLLTMDQDSKFDPIQLDNYISCFKEMNNETLGVIGISFFGSNTKPLNDLPCSQEQADTVITSGSIVNLTAWKKINGFNELLFIDGVDDEFCFRLHLENLLVIKLNNISLDHRLGNDVFVKNWHIGPIVKRNIHAPVRLYYMVRNYRYLIKKYELHFPAKTKEYKKTLLIKIKNNLLYSKGRCTLVNYIARGIIDAKRKKLGKLDS